MALTRNSAVFWSDQASDYPNVHETHEAFGYQFGLSKPVKWQNCVFYSSDLSKQPCSTVCWYYIFKYCYIFFFYSFIRRTVDMSLKIFNTKSCLIDLKALPNNIFNLTSRHCDNLILFQYWRTEKSSSCCLQEYVRNFINFLLIILGGHNFD